LISTPVTPDSLDAADQKAVRRKPSARDRSYGPSPANCVATGRAAKTAAMHSVDCRCLPGSRSPSASWASSADVAVVLSLSVTHKAVGFDRRMPEVASMPSLCPVRARCRSRRTCSGRNGPLAAATPLGDHGKTARLLVTVTHAFAHSTHRPSGRADAWIEGCPEWRAGQPGCGAPTGGQADRRRSGLSGSTATLGRGRRTRWWWWWWWWWWCCGPRAGRCWPRRQPGAADQPR